MKDQELLIAEYCMLSTANVSDGLDRIGVDGTPHGIGPLWDRPVRSNWWMLKRPMSLRFWVPRVRSKRGVPEIFW